MSSRRRRTAAMADAATGADRAAPPCALVIFGASGDLTRRLLIPSLCHLRQAGLLAEDFAVVGVARTEMDDDAFRRTLQEAGEGTSREAWRWLAPRLRYCAGAFDDPATYRALGRRLAESAATRGLRGNALFY